MWVCSTIASSPGPCHARTVLDVGCDGCFPPAADQRADVRREIRLLLAGEHRMRWSAAPEVRSARRPLSSRVNRAHDERVAAHAEGARAQDDSEALALGAL